jgi:hypothetical protein
MITEMRSQCNLQEGERPGGRDFKERAMMADRGEEESAAAAESVEDEALETGGETTAAATGPAEIGAAAGKANGATNAPPVGADTMVKVAGETDSD